MRHAAARLLVLLLGLLSCGCAGVKTVGLGVAEPRVGKYTLQKYVSYVEVPSLRPNFRWAALDPEDLAPGARLGERMRDITYELRIWEQTEHGSELVLRRAGVVGTEFRPDAPLRPETRYLWSVRAWFVLDGKRRATNWALAGDPLEKEALPNLSCLRFRTPAS